MALLVFGAVGLIMATVMLLAGLVSSGSLSAAAMGVCFLVIGIRKRVPPQLADALGDPPKPEDLDSNSVMKSARRFDSPRSYVRAFTGLIGP